MNKVLKILGLITVVILIIVVFYAIGNKNKVYKEQGNMLRSISENMNETKSANEKNLEEQLKNAKEKITQLEQQELIDEDSSYLSLKFKTDGHYYKDSDDQIKFYSDSNCSKLVKDQRFISSIIDQITADNGATVYAVMNDKGQIVYCTKRPYLVTEEKYNQIHKK